MQNLTLPLMQASPVKMKVESDATSNKGAGNAKEQDQMFASILKKQVNQKETQGKQGANTTSANQRAELAEKAAAKNRLLKESDANKQESIADDMVTEVKADVITNNEIDIKTTDKTKDSRQDIAEAQASQDTLIAQMGLPTMLNPTSKAQLAMDSTNHKDALEADAKEAKAIDLSALVIDGETDEGNQTTDDMLPPESSLANVNTIDSKKLESTDTKTHTKASDQKTTIGLTEFKDIPLKGADVKGADVRGVDVRGVDVKEAGSKELNVKELVTKDSLPPTQFVRTELNTTIQANAALLTAQQIEKADQINIGFGKPGWNQAINQKIMWMVGAADHSATLTLNPPDLGPLQVVLKVGNDQVDTTFISDNPEVRQALQDGMTMLRDKMQESGLQLGNTNISSNEQSQRDFQQAAQNRAQQGSSKAVDSNISDTSEVMPKVVKQQASNGLVDTFA